MILLRKHQAFTFYCIVTITMALWSYCENSEHSVSTALLRSQCHDYLTVKTPSILYLQHCYDHNDTNVSRNKIRIFCFYCIVTIIMPRWCRWFNSEKSLSPGFYDHNAAMILLRQFWAYSLYYIVTITMPRWSLWENSVQCLSTALLRSQRHDDLTEKSTKHSDSTALLQSQWHDGLTEKVPSILFLLQCYDQNASMISLSKLRAFYFYCIVTFRNSRWSHWVNSENSVFTALLTITMTRCSNWTNSEHSLYTS
jgi:hypothetical protein